MGEEVAISLLHTVTTTKSRLRSLRRATGPIIAIYAAPRYKDLVIEDDLIARIYEAAAMPELWPATLSMVARFVGAEGGVILRHSSQGEDHLFSPELEELSRGWQEGGWHIDNQRIAR